MRLCFFCSLMNRDLLCRVVGHDCAALSFAPARLPGYQTNRVKDEDYPVLVQSAQGSVTGVVVEGLDQDDIDRIRFFEDDEYVLETSYKLQLTKNFSVTPDLQLLFNPAKTPQQDRIWMFGVRAIFTL